MEIDDIGSYTVVDYYDKPLLALHSDSVGYVVPMIKIVRDDLGLHWDNQRERINSSRIFNPVIVKGFIIDSAFMYDEGLSYVFRHDDGYKRNSSYLCLPLDEVGIFLSQINIKKSNKKSREVLYRYHVKCSAMMSDHLKSVAEISKFKHKPSMLL